MTTDPMDMVVGASGTSSVDSSAATALLTSASEVLATGDRDGAIDAYRNAFAADPSNVEVCFQLAYLLDLGGEEDEAGVEYVLY